jgi:predicted nucleic acid-binding protein
MPNPNPVVSNTTPLISLGEVGLFAIFHQLYGDVWIPQAVFDEYQIGIPHHPLRPDLVRLPWISVHPAPSDPAVPAHLDDGEREAIALARAVQARVLLMDERQGRAAAKSLNVPLAGTMAVLLTAKQHGMIALVQPYIDQMIGQGRRISPQLRALVLSQAGE